VSNPHADDAPSSDEPLSFDEVLRTTRSIRRRFDLDRRVELADIDACLELAIQAPSGSNAQGWRFVVVADEDKRAALAECYRAGHAAYRKRNSTVYTSAGSELIADSVTYLADNIQHVPLHVIPCIEGRLDGDAPDSARAAFMASIIPATWSFMLACRSRSLGTCWTTMHLARERDAAELLSIPYDDVTQVALIPVGHVLGQRLGAAARRPVPEIVGFDQWDGPWPVRH
jgi:nitroreductase